MTIRPAHDVIGLDRTLNGVVVMTKARTPCPRLDPVGRRIMPVAVLERLAPQLSAWVDGSAGVLCRTVSDVGRGAQVIGRRIPGQIHGWQVLPLCRSSSDVGCGALLGSQSQALKSTPHSVVMP